MLQHFPAARVITPDIKFDVNVMPCLVDAFGQRREKLIAIDQEPRAFPSGDSEFVELGKEIDDRLFCVGQSLHKRFGMRGDFSFLARPGRVHCAGGAELLPNESICSKDKIKERTEVGKKNHRPDPG